MTEKSRSDESGQSQANNDRAVYEIGFHIVPTIDEAQAAAALGRMKEALAKAGASIVAEEAPKRTHFAYRIERSIQGKREKFTEGHFGWIKFEADREAIPALETMLRGDYEILRFLLIHAPREMVSHERHAVFSSSRLEGETIAKPKAAEERGAISEEELDKSIETLVGEQSESK